MLDLAQHRILGPAETIVLAHRGSAVLWPENTLLAFRNAVELGCPLLELDVHLTADGELVVCHDETVDRTTNGRGKVADLTVRQIQALDAGYRHADASGDFPFRDRGLVIPKLSEVFDALPEAAFNVELKLPGPGVRLLADMIRERGLEERVVVAGRLHAVLQRFRELSRGTVATGASRREILHWRALTALGMGSWSQVAYAVLQVPPRYGVLPLLSPRSIAVTHRAGLKVHAWTINDPAEMRQLVSMGVDGIITDRPDLLRDVLNRD